MTLILYSGYLIHDFDIIFMTLILYS